MSILFIQLEYFVGFASYKIANPPAVEAPHINSLYIYRLRYHTSSFPYRMIQDFYVYGLFTYTKSLP